MLPKPLDLVLWEFLVGIQGISYHDHSISGPWESFMPFPGVQLFRPIQTNFVSLNLLIPTLPPNRLLRSLNSLNPNLSTPARLDKRNDPVVTRSHVVLIPVSPRLAIA